MPGHGHSPIDRAAAYDEPYLRQGAIGFIEKLDLCDVTLVGESIGGVLALTVAAAIPQRVKRVYALNAYDYETRYGDGIRRGNWFANFIIGSLQVPMLGAFNAALENTYGARQDHGRRISRSAQAAAGPPDRVRQGGTSSGLQACRAQGAGRLAVVEQGAGAVRGDLSARDAHLRRQRLVSPGRAGADAEPAWPDARLVTLKDTGHFSAVENPSEIAKILLEA